MSKRRKKRVKITLDLDDHTHKFLVDVAALADVTMDDLVNVILALHFIRTSPPADPGSGPPKAG